jgi:hypothetical protein
MIRFFYNEGLLSKGRNHFLPLLQIVERYPFPKPLNCSRSNKQLHWVNTKINSITSNKFLKYIDSFEHPEMNYVMVDDVSEKHLQLSIAQNELGSGLGLSNLKTFLTLQQIKSLFTDLIYSNSTCYNATCGNDISEFLGRNFSSTQRSTKTLLSWMEYFGKVELEKRGGLEAFETNPYLKTQRIHDGLLVQVGDSPDVFDTPQGEILLVNAINALPLVKQ